MIAALESFIRSQLFMSSSIELYLQEKKLIFQINSFWSKKFVFERAFIYNLTVPDQTKGHKHKGRYMT